jgi:hypothetical protein
MAVASAWNLTTARTTTPDLEILVQQANVDVAASIVLDATAVAPDGNGERRLVAGTPLCKDATSNQYRKWVTADAAVTPIRGILSISVLFADGTSKSDAPAAMWNHGQWFRTDRIVGWAGDAAAIKAALPTCKFGL